MFSLLIVEDERPVADELCALVRRFEQEHGEKFEVTMLGAAFEMLDNSKAYDICLLDIDLPGINGMEAAQMLRLGGRATEIIFVTNLAQYAIRGYEVNAVGFIVKPATYASLSMNLKRALRDLHRGVHRTIVVSQGGGETTDIPLEQLLYVEARDHDLIYHLADGSQIRERRPLSSLGAEFGGAPLVKVSRYCLANMGLIRSIGNDVELVSGDRLHIPRGRKKEIAEQLTRYLGGRL